VGTLPIRSPAEQIGGLVYFGRMLDKIRANERGELPDSHTPNLGKGFDGECCEFLGVEYEDVVARVKAGASDDEVFDWCRTAGRQRSERDVFVWNEFMRKRGWNDEITPTLERRKRESGFEARADIRTMFNYIDADEGRELSSC
jgi:hypothetical protein